MAEVVATKRKCWLWFPIKFTVYSIVKDNNGDYELVIQAGLLNKNEEKAKIYRITDISYHRTLGNLIFGVGDITLSTSDPSTRSHYGSIHISKVKGYKAFGQQIEDLAFSERKRMNINYQETNIIK